MKEDTRRQFTSCTNCLVMGMDIDTARRYIENGTKITACCDRVNVFATFMTMLSDCSCDGYLKIDPWTFGYMGKLFKTEIAFILQNFDDFARVSDVEDGLVKIEQGVLTGKK